LNSCTTDECISYFCQNTPLPENDPCDDGEFCIIDGHCVLGICVGVPNPCDDGDPTTRDICDDENGVCINEPMASVSIDSPADGAEFMVGDVIEFTGSIVDTYPPTAANIEWSVHGTTIASGLLNPEWNTITMEEGEYPIKLSYTNILGEYAEDIITIKLLANYEYSYNLLFIPVDWEGSYSDMENYAEEFRDYYVDKIPLRDCTNKFNLIIPEEDKDYGTRWDGWICDISSSHNYGSNTLNYIENCADQFKAKTGQDYDRGFGAVDADVCYGSTCGYLGWTDYGSDVVITETTYQFCDDPAVNDMYMYFVTAHELGHTFNLRDQYCDCSGTPKASKCGPTVSQNPLMPESSCDPTEWKDKKGGCKLSTSGGPYHDDCRWVVGNLDMVSEDNDNDGTLDQGYRTLMSNNWGDRYTTGGYVTLQEGSDPCSNLDFQAPRYYTTEGYDYIKQYGEMQC
jgi:hypothetical protein